MKDFLKRILSPIRSLNELIQRRILRLLGGAGFANPYFGVGRLWTHLIVQKVFRINSHVPWPVHWTAVVKSPEKIERGRDARESDMGRTWTAVMESSSARTFGWRAM